jgi:hypothetical protein
LEVPAGIGQKAKSEGVGLPLTISLWEVALAVLLLNIPFGFWRDGTKRFTLPWLLAVHLPVPIVVGFRVLSTPGWRLTTFPVLIGSFFLGQFLGGKVHQWWEWRKTPGGAEAIKKSFEKRMRRLMLYRKEVWPYEFEFWRMHRGLG